jgi:hypothetical protein
MKVIVRKVTKAKWNNQLTEDNELNLVISADAITGCLRTKSNTLSIWNVDNEKDAILALASMNDSIVPIDYIIFDNSFFSANQIDIKNVVSQSNPVEGLRDKHYDIVNLDYESLGKVSKEIASKIVLDKKNYIKRYKANDVKELLKEAISTKKLKIEDLNHNLQKKLE